jgi:hypothetical protein
MEPTDEQIVLDIIERAQNCKFTEVHFIKSLDEFFKYYQYNKSTGIVIKLLKKSSGKLFKVYCKEILKGTADVEQLLAYAQLDEITKFYITDFNRIQQVIEEYKTYLCQGNFIRALLGEERNLGD